MVKKLKIVKKGNDEGNLLYWVSLSFVERMRELEKMRTQVIKMRYGTPQGFQRVYRITQRTSS